MRILRVLPALLLTVSGAFAQLAAPNAQGVAIGHMHITVADVDAAKKFWTEVIGAQPWQQTTLVGVSLPGVIIIFRQGVATGPSLDTSVDHIGFTVPDPRPYVAKAEAAGIKHTALNAFNQTFLDTSDGLRVEVTEDKTQTIPIRFHHIHFHATDDKAMQEWYAKYFGATPGTRRSWITGNLPGGELTYVKAATVAPTKGRALDHIGFEIKDLEAFCKKLTDAGVKLDTPFRPMPQLNLKLAFLTDPWGTRIELTEGLGLGK